MTFFFTLIWHNFFAANIFIFLTGFDPNLRLHCVQQFSCEGIYREIFINAHD